MTTTNPSNTPPESGAPPQVNDHNGDHPPQPAQRTADPAPTADRATPVRRTTAGRSRLGSMWVSLIGMSVVLVILLIFVLQNPTSTEIRFLWLDGQLPIGVAMLFASIAGILLVAIPATGRIWQLRRGIRRNHTR
jgi:uncharacterized integral membrane protein